jgi:hypothetical protein
MLSRIQIKAQAIAENVSNLPRQVEILVATIFNESAKLEKHYQKLNIIKEELQSLAMWDIFFPKKVKDEEVIFEKKIPKEEFYYYPS